MAIRYAIEQEGDLLRVVASGRDDGLEDAIAYARAVLEAGAAGGARRALCDERDLTYTLAAAETYQLGKFVAEHAGSVVRVALVYRVEQTGDAEFWELVTANRGLRVRTFHRIADAEHWLAGGD